MKRLDKNYSPQDRRTIAKKFKRDYKRFRKMLKKNFRYIKFFALTSDFWENRPHEHFLGLTIHFFDRKFKYYSALIAFKKFKGRKFAHRIKPFILKILRKLEIENKIVAIVTDNGADIKKATITDFGERISCATHNLNLTAHTVVTFKKV